MNNPRAYARGIWFSQTAKLFDLRKNVGTHFIPALTGRGIFVGMKILGASKMGKFDEVRGDNECVSQGL